MNISFEHILFASLLCSEGNAPSIIDAPEQTSNHANYTYKMALCTIGHFHFINTTSRIFYHPRDTRAGGLILISPVDIPFPGKVGGQSLGVRGEIRYKLPQFDKRSGEPAERATSPSIFRSPLVEEEAISGSSARLTRSRGMARPLKADKRDVVAACARCATWTIQKIDMVGGINMESRTEATSYFRVSD